MAGRGEGGLDGDHASRIRDAATVGNSEPKSVGLSASASLAIRLGWSLAPRSDGRAGVPSRPLRGRPARTNSIATSATAPAPPCAPAARPAGRDPQAWPSPSRSWALAGCGTASPGAPEVGFPERRLAYRWRRVITPENAICSSVVPGGRDIEGPPIPPNARIAPA